MVSEGEVVIVVFSSSSVGEFRSIVGGLLDCAVLMAAGCDSGVLVVVYGTVSPYSDDVAMAEVS